jgi:hypothetical protein
VSVYCGIWRVVASARPAVGPCVALLALCGASLMGGDHPVFAQGMSEQQLRCLQLQQDLAAASGGGGANREDLARIEQQIAQADRVFQGTQAAMDDARCFESFFIFGRGLVRSPQCLKMNDRVEDARRQLSQLQQQRQALLGGGGNRRRQAELQDAMARSGCGGQVAQPKRRGGGLFDFFGGGQDDEEQMPLTPIYRSIDPNGRYHSVCVRLCDGFFYPIHYSTYGSQLSQDAQTCQSNCAAPAELYVYRNPGQEIEQAVSLNGSAYVDLPVALRFRKEYVKGCSCKQAEYNPTEIEAANKQADADQPAKGKTKATAAAPPPPEAPAPDAAPPAAAGDQQQPDLDITGSNEPAAPPAATAAAPAAAPPAPVAVPPAQKPPAPPAAASPPPAPPPASASAGSAAAPAQSTVIKKAPKPAAPTAGPFAPQ